MGWAVRFISNSPFCIVLWLKHVQSYSRGRKRSTLFQDQAYVYKSKRAAEHAASHYEHGEVVRLG